MPADTEFLGKVRRLLYWPFGSKSLVVAEKEVLSMWDMETQTRFNTLPLPSSLLDLASLLIRGKPYLVVLAANGRHYFFRYSDSGENWNRDASYDVLAHPGLEIDSKYGVLTALDSVIASSVGTGIYMRVIANQGHSCNYINFSQKGLTNSSITALQLVSRSRLIVASSRLKEIFVVDIVSENCLQSLTLDYHLCYILHSPGAGLLLINDPLVGCHFLNTSSMSPAGIPKLGVHQKAPDPLTPLYVCFCETGHFVVVTQNQSLFLYDIRSGSLVYNVDVACARLFSVALVVDHTIVRIFAALRPRRRSETWAIRSWDIRRSCLTCFEEELINPSGTPSPEACRFINFRLIQPSNPSAPERFRSLRLSSGNAWYKALEWLPIQNEQHRAIMKSQIPFRPVSKPNLGTYRLQHDQLHIRNLFSEVYSTCDVCYMALFFGVWFCAYCGFEVCTPCYSTMVPDHERPRSFSPCPKTHAQSWVFPVSYFTEAQIQDILLDLKKVTHVTTMATPSGCTRPVPLQSPLERDDHIDNRHHTIPRYKFSELTEEFFLGLWNYRAPFIVNAIDGLCTTPDRLFDLGKNNECTVSHFDGFCWHNSKTTLEAYFQEWLQEHAWPRRLTIFPNPQPDVADKFEHFLQKVSPQYFSSHGPLNLISHLPMNHIAPKLGPMLRISEKDSMSSGSQFLQVNFTGMANVLVHSQTVTSDIREGARWDIWPHSSIPLLAKIAEPDAPLSECELGGPISRATCYLGRGLLADAATAGAIPWTCIQNPGDVLFIPPGCPHQVSNLSNCVHLIKKVLPMTDVPLLRSLQPMLRYGNIVCKKLQYKDQVRLDILLWYTWLSAIHEESTSTSV